MLCKAGLVLYDIPISKKAINYVLEKDGYKFITLGKPKKGESRPIVEDFVKTVDKNSIYILNLADYFVTIENGEIYDVSDDCLKSSVYSYWIK
jgi:hypothetical protein